jgi:non-heme Fe2+,alpha-ketoglutarate-dependent halogenase
LPKFLNQQQVDLYHEQGYLAPIDVMSEQDALAYRQRFESIEREHPDQVNPENRNNAHLVAACLDELVYHPSIVDAVNDLIGPDISLWGTVLFIKEPQTAGYVSWHQDATYMGIEPHEFVTPWLALTPSNRECGCMSMIPGSHRDPVRNHKDTFADDNLLTRGQEVAEVDETRAVDIVLRPGQMSLHHARIVHGSQPNRSQHRRIGFAMQAYMAPPARQVLGENYWLKIRGEQFPENCIALQRPRFDMDPEGIERRKLVNQNWSSILYQGADQKRAY